MKRTDQQQAPAPAPVAESDTTGTIVLGVAGSLVAVALVLLFIYLIMRYRQMEADRAILAAQFADPSKAEAPADSQQQSAPSHSRRHKTDTSASGSAEPSPAAAARGAVKSQSVARLLAVSTSSASAPSPSQTGSSVRPLLPSPRSPTSASKQQGGDHHADEYIPTNIPAAASVASVGPVPPTRTPQQQSVKPHIHSQAQPRQSPHSSVAALRQQQPQQANTSPSPLRHQQQQHGSIHSMNNLAPTRSSPNLAMAAMSGGRGVGPQQSGVRPGDRQPPQNRGPTAAPSTSPAASPARQRNSPHQPPGHQQSAARGREVVIAPTGGGVGNTTTGYGATTLSTLIATGVRTVAVPGYLKLPPTCYTPLNAIGEGGEGAIWKAYITDETLEALSADRQLLHHRPGDGADAQRLSDFAQRVQHFEREVVRVPGRTPAERPRDQRVVIVAVKVTYVAENQAVYPGEVQDKFYQEVSILATLQNHPNIVELVGYCDEGQLSLIMKMYYANLKSLLYAGGEFETLPVFDFAEDLANAMTEMHNNGIIHCDLKSPNLLVDHDGKRLKLVVTDFGVSQVESAFEQVRMRINVVVDAASFSYAAPEVLESFFADPGAAKKTGEGTTVALYNEADPSRDIYAAAVIIWEMLAKELAFLNIPAQTIYQIVVQQNVRPPLPFDWQSATSDNMKAAWRRYEKRFGTSAVEALARLVQICWAAETERRLSAQVLSEWIGDIRKSHNL